MKRFLVFAWHRYEAIGGMGDFQEDFDTVDEARDFETKLRGDGYEHTETYDIVNNLSV